MTSSRLATYSADLVACSLAAFLVDSGFADGEFINVEPTTEDWIVKVGSDGEVARAKSNNKSATIKIKLLQTSLTNNRLQALRQLDINVPNGAGVGVFRVTDLSSGVLLCQADKTFIMKPPTISRAREIAEYEWTLFAASMDFDFSGNPSL